MYANGTAFAKVTTNASAFKYQSLIPINTSLLQINIQQLTFCFFEYVFKLYSNLKRTYTDQISGNCFIVLFALSFNCLRKMSRKSWYEVFDRTDDSMNVHEQRRDVCTAGTIGNTEDTAAS